MLLEKLAPAAEEPEGKGRHRSVQRATGLKQVMLLMVRIVTMVVVSMETMTMVTGRMISATFVQHQQVDVMV